MQLSLWIKFCIVFIGSIFLTGDLLSQNDTQSDSLNLKQGLYAIDIDGNGDLDALIDRAQNFKTYDFTEIVRFDVDE